MDVLLQGPGLILLAIGLTWSLAILLGSRVTRRRLASWIGKRWGELGPALIVLGAGLVLVGLMQGGSALGISLLLLGSLLGLVGLWLLLPV
jgi:hypothetical protein